jgi:hypothetical protein
MQLRVVAEVPDEVTGSRLPLEQTCQRLDAVAIYQQHREKLMCLRSLDKTPKLAETYTFTQAVEISNPQEWNFLPRVSISENG